MLRVRTVKDTPYPFGALIKKALYSSPIIHSAIFNDTIISDRPLVKSYSGKFSKIFFVILKILFRNINFSHNLATSISLLRAQTFASLCCEHDQGVNTLAWTTVGFDYSLELISLD
jgi:hypothetical protein